MPDASIRQVVGFVISGLCFVSAALMYFAARTQKPRVRLSSLFLVGLGLMAAGVAGNGSGYSAWNALRVAGLAVIIFYLVQYGRYRAGDLRDH